MIVSSKKIKSSPGIFSGKFMLFLISKNLLNSFAEIAGFTLSSWGFKGNIPLRFIRGIIKQGYF